MIFQVNEFLDKNPNDSDFEPTKKLLDVLLMNSGRLNGLEHDKAIGILDRDTQRITTAEVQTATLYIIDELSNSVWDYQKTNVDVSFKTKLIEKVEDLHENHTPFDYDIFICFSTKDRALAKPIWETFRGYGLRVFVSDEDLQNAVGSNFLNKIDHALGNSQHMVLFASKNSLQSVYVQDEYQSFYSDCHVKDPQNRLLIVYRLSDFPISKMPRILRTKQIASSTEQVVATLVQGNLLNQGEANSAPMAFGASSPAITTNPGKFELNTKRLKILIGINVLASVAILARIYTPVFKDGYIKDSSDKILGLSIFIASIISLIVLAIVFIKKRNK